MLCFQQAWRGSNSSWHAISNELQRRQTCYDEIMLAAGLPEFAIMKTEASMNECGVDNSMNGSWIMDYGLL